MPYGDRTGPSGQGPLSGRGLGICNDSNAQFFGFGRKRGRGNRRFARFDRVCSPSLEEEQSILNARLEEISKQLEK